MEQSFWESLDWSSPMMLGVAYAFVTFWRGIPRYRKNKGELEVVESVKWPVSMVLDIAYPIAKEYVMELVDRTQELLTSAIEYVTDVATSTVEAVTKTVNAVFDFLRGELAKDEDEEE